MSQRTRSTAAVHGLLRADTGRAGGFGSTPVPDATYVLDLGEYDLSPGITKP